MANGVYEVNIKQSRGHWEVYINGEFFCSADRFSEAIDEIRNAFR